MRQFNSGATRDSEEGKYDYEGFFSPLVIKRYGEYMHKHRKQADGKLRDSDNWQKHFGEHHYDVCIKSLWRHFMDLWMEHRGFSSRDGIEDALMAILFNTMAYTDKLLKDKLIQNERPWIIIGKCEKDKIDEKAICDLGYACDACPYNKDDRPNIIMGDK